MRCASANKGFTVRNWIKVLNLLKSFQHTELEQLQNTVHDKSKAINNLHKVEMSVC